LHGVAGSLDADEEKSVGSHVAVKLTLELLFVEAKCFLNGITVVGGIPESK
jgi:hypothetical protein